MEQIDNEIYHRRQKPGETFRDFDFAMQNLMKHYTITQQVEQICQNCREEYQLYIRRRGFQDLQDRIRLIVNIENIAATTESNRHASGPQQVERNLMVAENLEVRDNVSTSCRNCGEKGHTSRDCCWSLLCWDCGRRNISTMECCQKPVEPYPVNFLNFDTSRIFASITLGDELVKATIDTGATRSIISELYAYKLRNSTNTMPMNLTLNMAEGTPKHIKEALKLDVRIGNNYIQFVFLILPEAIDKVILGFDFLLRIKAKFSCAGHTIELQEQSKQIKETPPRYVTTQLPDMESDDNNSGNASKAHQTKDPKTIQLPDMQTDDDSSGNARKGHQIKGPKTIQLPDIDTDEDGSGNASKGHKIKGAKTIKLPDMPDMGSDDDSSGSGSKGHINKGPKTIKLPDMGSDDDSNGNVSKGYQTKDPKTIQLPDMEADEDSSGNVSKVYKIKGAETTKLPDMRIDDDSSGNATKGHQTKYSKTIQLPAISSDDDSNGNASKAHQTKDHKTIQLPDMGSDDDSSGNSSKRHQTKDHKTIQLPDMGSDDDGSGNANKGPKTIQLPDMGSDDDNSGHARKGHQSKGSKTIQLPDIGSDDDSCGNARNSHQIKDHKTIKFPDMGSDDDNSGNGDVGKSHDKKLPTGIHLPGISTSHANGSRTKDHSSSSNSSRGINSSIGSCSSYGSTNEDHSHKNHKSDVARNDNHRNKSINGTSLGKHAHNSEEDPGLAKTRRRFKIEPTTWNQREGIPSLVVSDKTKMKEDITGAWPQELQAKIEAIKNRLAKESWRRKFRFLHHQEGSSFQVQVKSNGEVYVKKRGEMVKSKFQKRIVPTQKN